MYYGLLIKLNRLLRDRTHLFTDDAVAALRVGDASILVDVGDADYLVLFLLQRQLGDRSCGANLPTQGA